MDLVAHLPLTRGHARSARLRDAAAFLGFLALLATWAMTLRPVSMGGPGGYVLVRGVSMLPTFHTGDLVLTRKQPSYSAGDVVAYRVPGGQFGAGTVVIHRITGGSGEAGFVLRGDNNPADDDWHPRTGDVVGRAWIHVPRLGLLLAALRAPLPLASAVTAFTIALLFMSPSRPKSTDDDPLVFEDTHAEAIRFAMLNGGTHGALVVAEILGRPSLERVGGDKREHDGVDRRASEDEAVA